MHSCIYEGKVTHCRRQPLVHEFQYRLFMLYLDLDELPSLVGSGCLISESRHAGRSFLRDDHLFDSARPLREEILAIVREKTGRTTEGPIRVLTQLRYLGVYFSPLNLFYLFDKAGERVDTVVAEVSNTPWNERHCYVLWDGNQSGNDCSDSTMRFSHPKQFHVSPFMDMNMDYDWRLLAPGARLSVRLANRIGSREIFYARMELKRGQLNRQELRRMTIGYPLMTARISAAIYYQALRLWWKKCPFYPHPKKRNHDSSPPAEE